MADDSQDDVQSYGYDEGGAGQVKPSFDQLMKLLDRRPTPTQQMPMKQIPGEMPPAPQPQVRGTPSMAGGQQYFMHPTTPDQRQTNDSSRLSYYQQVGNQMDKADAARPQPQGLPGSQNQAQIFFQQLQKANPNATPDQLFQVMKQAKESGMFDNPMGKGNGQLQYMVQQFMQMGMSEADAFDKAYAMKRASPQEYGQRAEAVNAANLQGKPAIAGAEEMAKKNADIDTAADLKSQDAIGVARGAADVDLAKIEASMPQIKKTVSDLKNLAQAATYTVGGKLYNDALRQLGQPMSAGGNARAEYDARIKNVLLPSLKASFGSRVTNYDINYAQSILGDPNLSPSEKEVQLNAFLDQKYEQTKTDKRTLQNLGGKVKDVQEDAAPAAPKTVNWSDLP